MTTAETKGIWIQCKPHPTQEGQVLMLMDTEGLGDIKKVYLCIDCCRSRGFHVVSSLLIDYRRSVSFNVSRVVGCIAVNN